MSRQRCSRVRHRRPGQRLPAIRVRHLHTTNRCQDINFSNRSQSGDQTFQALIRVCFVAAGYCQSSWKYYYSDANTDWMVIASDVRDGTTFRLEFQFFESTFGSTYGNLIAF
jgi:hypothetical protein